MENTHNWNLVEKHKAGLQNQTGSDIWTLLCAGLPTQSSLPQPLTPLNTSQEGHCAARGLRSKFMNVFVH